MAYRGGDSESDSESSEEAEALAKTLISFFQSDKFEKGRLAKGEDVKAVQNLLSNKADPNEEDKDRRTPLMVAAARFAHPAVVELLLKGKADVNAADRNAKTPLMYAALSWSAQSPVIVELLLKSKADSNATDYGKKTPLMFAAENKSAQSPAIVELLLEAGADVNASDKWKKTPLLYAARNESAQARAVVELLLKAGADVNATDYSERTPLMSAAENESAQSPAIVEWLLKAEADVNAADDYDKKTPLMFAAENKSAQSPAIVERLLKAGADVNATDKGKKTPLIFTAENESAQSPAIVERLLKAGADVNATDYNGQSAILLAVNRGNLAALEGFAMCMDITKDTLFDGMTFLMVASKHNNGNLATLVLKRKADVNQKNEMRPGGASTALMIAAQQGHCGMIQFLLEHGAHINAVNKFLKPALLFAAEHENASLLVPLLLSCGANIDAQETQNSETALTIVIKKISNNDQTILLQLLSVFKPNIQLSDKDGNTALAIVAKRKKLAKQDLTKTEKLVEIEALIRDTAAREHAFMRHLFAPLSMFFVVWLPTRSWDIPARRMPNNNIVIFCFGLLLCAFVYLRADFLLVLSAPMHFLSQRAELIRKYLDSFVDQSDTAANVVRWFYVAVSISFSWWMRRTRPVITATPISRKLRLSPKLDRTMVNAIHYFAQAVKPELGEYLITSPFSVDDVASGWEEKKPSATTAGPVGTWQTSQQRKGSQISISDTTVTKTGDSEETGTAVVSDGVILRHGSRVKKRWSFTIKTSWYGHRQTIGVVTAAYDAASDGDFSKTNEGWGYQHDGNKSHGYEYGNRAYGPPYETGDIVDVQVSAASRMLRFFVNGVDQGVAFADLPLDTPIYGAASLFRKDSKIVYNGLDQSLEKGNSIVSPVSRASSVGDSLSSPWKERIQQWIMSFFCFALGFCKTYVTIHVWTILAHKLSGLYSALYSALFAAVPETTFSLVLPAILCYFVPSLGGRERKLGIYTCLVILCSCFGTFSMILFWINMSLNLHLTYVITRPTPVTQTVCHIVDDRPTPVRRRSTYRMIATVLHFDCLHFVTEFCTKLVFWFLLDMTFVAGFCTKLVSYHCDITSLLLTAVMFLTFCEVYKTASIWAHGEDHKDGYTYTFERGDADTQLKFVGRKWRVFSIIFAAAALCTMGQIHTTPPSTVQPETISRVFCKTNHNTQLECLVNTTYFNPSESGPEKCFCNSTSTEWEFCGSWQAYPVHDKFELDHHPFPADCTCSLSGPCLSADPAALVLAASQHNTKAHAIIGIESQKMPIFGYSVFSPYEFLSSASLIRNGFQCRFRSDHGWEPKVTKAWANPFGENHVYPWDNPMHFIARVSISVFGRNESLVYPKEVHMKITPGMLTTDRPAQNVEATQSSEDCKMEHPELSNEQLMKLLLQRAKQGELTTLDADSFGDEAVKELKDVLSQLAPTRRPTQKAAPNNDPNPQPAGGDSVTRKLP